VYAGLGLQNYIFVSNNQKYFSVFIMPIIANSYKNIIFDLGGVLININYSLTSQAFEALGLGKFDELFSQAHQTKLFDLYEKGLITSDEFRARVKTFFSQPIDDHTIDAAWNAMLLDFPKKRLDFLKKIKTTHRTFLLSNTNDIHIQTINAELQRVHGIPNLCGHFEKVYLSYEVHMRKPDAEIFELVLRENSLEPSDTLFIDDSPQHLETAKKLGIQTYWLDTKKETVLDLFTH
jgi:putative hydrolase of the HAD superfamily